MLAAEYGSRITLIIDGPDEESAMAELSEILLDEHDGKL